MTVPLKSGLRDNDYYKKTVEGKNSKTLCVAMGSLLAENEKLKVFLLLGRKAMTNLDSILKSRDISLLTKVHLVKTMVFPVVMYGCESCIIKKAEH